MKTKFIVFLVLFSALFCSCTESNVPQNKSRRSANVISDPEQLFYENSRQYVTDKPDLFGHNVLFFASPDEVMQELEILSSTDYIGMRDWQHQHNFYNPILNSIIVHDSVIDKAFSHYGIVFDHDITNATNISDDKLDDAFDEYDYEMTFHFSQYVKTTIDDNGATKLSPLGFLDDRVFTNDMDLYVCGGVVVKYYDDGVLNCPYDEYEAYEGCTSASQARDIQKNSGSKYASVSPANSTKITRDEHFEDSNIALGNKRRMEIYFRLSVNKSIFGLLEWCYVYMTATNYHRKANGEYRTFACETKVNADILVDCPYILNWSTSIRTGWFPMKGGMTYIRLKAYPYCGCNRTSFRKITVDAQNIHGCVISDTKNY